ncbi:MAG: hypothetical protein K2G44_01895 [Clostridia bacterium]|nr:hypothetical protein [Clostridia bacterium]
MKIEEYERDSIAAYIKAERYVNDGSPSRFSQNTTKIGAPTSAIGGFDVVLAELPKDIFCRDVGDEQCGLPKGTMLIHPDMMDNPILRDVGIKQCGKEFVYPTASGRTVFDADDKRFYKLAYLNYLGRIIRHMEYNRLMSAKEATDLLVRVATDNRANKRFSLLKEDCGRVAFLPIDPKTVDPSLKIPQQCIDSGLYEWGVLFREFNPYPYVKEKEYLVPFFSLFGGEYKPETNEFSKDHEIFISQIFKKQSKSLERFLLDELLFPLYNTYFDCLLLGGVELEAHAQNMLVTLNKDYQIKRIVCRDLESAGRDMDLIKYLNIDYATTITDYKCNYRKPKDPDQKYDKYTITHSFMFDFKLGEYIVTPMLEKLKQIYPSMNIAQITEELKDFNRQFIKLLPLGFFPPDWCHYENINFEETGKPRVYIWQDNPKYR